MRYRIRPILLTLLLGNSAIVFGDKTTQPIDTSAWKCKYCIFEQGFSHNLEGGLGYVSQDSYKFGEYSGLQDQGAFFIGNITSRYRNYDNAHYWDINAADVGLDTRSLKLHGGKQGHYGVSLLYNELPHYLADTTHTPFLGSGESHLSLPANWVNAGSTTAMTTLNNALAEIYLQTKRTQLGVGALYIPVPKWETSINYRHESREGKRRIAGSFFFNSVELVQPVDYTTDLIDAAASYSGKRWQAKLAYHGSMFRNKNDSLIWQNPYSPLVPGATQGELALAPDNQFHQALATIALHTGEASLLMADVTLGRMSQDEDFLNTSMNPNLAVSPLPATSLQGRVDTINANIKWNSEFGEKTRLNATYQYNDRNNKTPQHVYEWISTDTNVATPRMNVPYSYNRNTVKVSAEHKPMMGIKTALGYDYEQDERTYQEVEKSQEQTLWASFISRSRDGGNFIIKYAHASREKNGYQMITGIDSPENPLLRKYNMADRNRNTLGTRMDITMTDRSSVGISFDWAQDHYPDSAIGLNASQVSNVGLDFSTQASTNTTVSFFLSYEDITSRVANSQLYNIPDWSGKIKDNFNTGGIGFKHILIENKLDIGADYVHTNSRGQITLSQGGLDSSLPDLVTRLNSIKIYANYRLSETLVFNGNYWYERYSSSNWAFDDVYADTVPNNVSLGQESPSYNVNVFMASVRYQF